ncbi:helicase C-terminal domain-containing protein [Anaerobranca gottschalkii]|uniref:DNA 5'-3' helicase n=1 Tax=Anaerobranca gottschalkii DSM 13577 TaxID=1120990 RepID=A0A1H9ZTK0_9FIRM|nr:helicase C-terminal domain-containing protein [Anaerobranca gottschalkii]SES85072.1 ATP-dependent DNA helicase DinG [Anaerobranca gottschalkii DSM 13577]
MREKSVKFTEDVKKRIKYAIEQAKGNEVFFKGLVNEQKIIWDVEVLARGNQFSVPACLCDLEPGDVVIHNHPSGELTPSAADINIAAKLGADGIGFLIIDNSGEELYVVVEPYFPSEDIPISLESIQKILGEGGRIACHLENYEYRQEQIKMAEKIALSFNNQQHLLVEAGTGTGKSLAYLITAILWAVKNKKRVVISTNTINLQEQIMFKDIPFLQRVLADKFKGVLVKGRSNYLCLRKLESLETDSLLEDVDEDLSQLKALKEWGLKTTDGSKADLSFLPKETNWEQVCSEGDLCLKVHCHHYKDCFFFKARRESATADILVVNHHLLFADIALRSKGLESGVLPKYHCIVFDEAHNIEDTATTYFGYKINKYLGIKQFTRLFYTKGGKQRGFLIDLNYKISSDKHITPIIKGRVNDLIILELIPQLGEMVKKTHLFFDNVYTLLNGNSKVRLTPAFIETAEYKDVENQCVIYIQELTKFIETLKKLLSTLEEMPSKAFEGLLPQVMELNAYIKRLEGVAETLDYLFLKEVKGDVKWLELSGTSKNRYVTANSAPLDISYQLNENIYTVYQSVILTSATLTTGGNFHYIKNRLGLNLCQYKLEELILPSPFNYKEQVLFCVPTNLPEPTQRDFELEIIDNLYQLIMATRGRAFVLFTSFKLLNETYEKLKPLLEDRGINCFKQGEMQRHLLLQNFKKDISSVLFATSSFWEGVDVQGEALSNVILVKLPFSVPDEPIVEARQELIQQKGGNPFMEYQVPQAVLRFKQGFGRLIRSKEDRGVVVVTDKRILTKTYGKIFLKSLPQCNELAGDLNRVTETIVDFL